MSASAYTGALAETRLSVLATQINYIVRETTGDSDFAQMLHKGIVENQWIWIVSVRAVDQKDRIWSEIEVRIDWDRHRINVRRDGETMLIDKKLPVGEQVTWTIGEMVRFF